MKFFLLICLLISANTYARDLVLTMGGDVNFNVSPQTPNANGVSYFGRMIPWGDISAELLPLIKGDLNFANIETVVTDENVLTRHNTSAAVQKQFVFQSHVNSIQHMVENNFNLFSLANNHGYDYGVNGYEKTLASMHYLKRINPELVYHGIGHNLQHASEPVVFKKNGMTIAFAAVSILDPTYRATNNAPGMIGFPSRELDLLLTNLREAKADYKILSIHYGTENLIQLDGGQRQLFNEVLRKGDIDLIIGHHPHVVRPIEIVNGKVIIYSLGNYMMLGARSMNGLGIGHDHGLFLEAKLAKDPKTQKVTMRSLKAIPLKDMHLQPKPWPYTDARKRIEHLNLLNQRQLGAEGAQFEIQNDGSGLMNLPQH